MVDRSLILTSTATHLATTSNIFIKMGLIALKLCIYAQVDTLIATVIFFLYEVARKTRALLNRLMDAVLEL